MTRVSEKRYPLCLVINPVNDSNFWKNSIFFQPQENKVKSMDTAGIEFSFLLEYITINFLGQTNKLCFQYKSTLYYVSEIPGELSHQNMLSSHIKITCYLHM